MVDPSLLRLAADRGVTICFADLDGADGLWVPEERTVLVDRRLSDHEVAEVIEHELSHVAIDDQHADLDAGVGRPPPTRSRRWAAALTAAACLALVGGVTAGLARDYRGADEGPVVAPSAPPLTAEPPAPGESVVTTRVVGPDGQIMVKTVTRVATPSATTPPPTSAGTVAPTATRPPTASVPPPQPSPTTPAPTSTQPDTGSPTVDPTTPPPSEPVVTTPAGAGDVVDDAGDGSGSADPSPSASTGTP